MYICWYTARLTLPRQQATVLHASFLLLLRLCNKISRIKEIPGWKSEGVHVLIQSFPLSSVTCKPFQLMAGLSLCIPPAPPRRYLGYSHPSPLRPVSPATHPSREAFLLPGCILRFPVLCFWLDLLLDTSYDDGEGSTSRKQEAVYPQCWLQRLQSLSQKQLGLSRPVVDHAHQKILMRGARGTREG